jgi:hypothetical protein
LFAAGVKVFYVLLCVLYATKVATILVSYLTYDPAGYGLPILSAVDYVVVAAGYLCLAHQTGCDSRLQRRLVRAAYGMFGFSGLLATVAAIGVLSRAWGLSQEVTTPAPPHPLCLVNILLTGTNAFDNRFVYSPWVESASVESASPPGGLTPQEDPNTV